MLEVDGDAKAITLYFTGDCWGGDSKITFSSNRKNSSISGLVTFFLNGQAIENTIDKKDIGSLTVAANSVSTNWDDIVIKATGTPISSGASSSGHTHDSCSNTIDVTAYSISQEAKEKPWDGSWNPPEDKEIISAGGSTSSSSGAASSSGSTATAQRTWYHLWAVNENAIRASVLPSCLADIVTDTSFAGLSVSAFSPESSAPTPNAKPKWKKIGSGVGFYEEVIATITADGKTLPGTHNKIDIVINDFVDTDTGFEWEETENSCQETQEGSGVVFTSANFAPGN